MKGRRWEAVLPASLALLYVAWAMLFIYKSSFTAIDGHRYFGLFDDAMISMRYGWNLAHGLGLVWNAGQRVEGYSNLLMTLAMALAALLLDKPLAVLAVQLMGIPTVLLTAVLARRLFHDTNADDSFGKPGTLLVFLCVLLYYPLSYWTLMGMESGLVTLFLTACIWFGLRWLRRGKMPDLAGMAAASALAFLTRNDSVLLTGMVFAYVAWEVHPQARERLRGLALAALAVGAVIAAQTAFRYLYYGSLLPNTYTLKLTGFPIYIRLIGGTRFVLEFLRQSWLVLVLALLGVALSRRRHDVLLASIVLVALAYQVYVGGDPWPSWRMLTPAMPAAFVLAARGATALVDRLKSLRLHGLAAALSAGVLVCAAVGLADAPFIRELTLQEVTSAAIANRVNTDSAIAIQALTLPGATVGVIWAGTLPYYVNRGAVDFLGRGGRLPGKVRCVHLASARRHHRLRQLVRHDQRAGPQQVRSRAFDRAAATNVHSSVRLGVRNGETFCDGELRPRRVSWSRRHQDRLPAEGHAAGMLGGV